MEATPARGPGSPHLSVVPAAVFPRAAAQGGQAGLAGLPAGSGRGPLAAGVTASQFQPVGDTVKVQVASENEKVEGGDA